MYEGSHVTPSQSFVLRYASRQSLVPYGTLVIKAPRALEQTVCDTCRLQTCRLADLQTCRLADLQTCRLADLQTCRLADLQTRRLADLQTCRLADLQTCRLADLESQHTSSSYPKSFLKSAQPPLRITCLPDFPRFRSKQT